MVDLNKTDIIIGVTIENKKHKIKLQYEFQMEIIEIPNTEITIFNMYIVHFLLYISYCTL